jgi:basic membrane protein A
VDQKAIIDGTYGEGMTLTSAMKGLAATIEDTLKDVIENDNWAAYGGKIATLGLISEDPAANYVQLPLESTAWTEGFSQEDYAALVKAMFAGEITVSSDITAQPAVGYTVNTYANIK